MMIVGVSMPPGLYEILVKRLARSGRTMEAEIVSLISTGLDAERKGRPDHKRKIKRRG